ncbi:Rop family plasmid primer RNA-binding protein [Aeromonas salmonicida]|uniref:Rop family plasmid primer RNA-binding protein n=1 Tax=Aeromonas salmonicida TaxID=645 RepID=UPI00223F3279|nr:Rop family plasmid primer RNA-binding protein [Aeromonas salmonicida]
MTKQESSALNMAKFIRAQLLLLLEKLDALDLDEEATTCEQLHEAAETLYRRLETRFNDEEHQSDKSG